MTHSLISDTVTEGIRVRAIATYVPEQSNPGEGRYFFGYRITISNEGAHRAKLLARHWIISNADGHSEQVRGPGVVGKYPDLAPGESFEYTSFCPLDTEWGTMEGKYQMQREDGEFFDVAIGRFFLTNTMPGVA